MEKIKELMNTKYNHKEVEEGKLNIEDIDFENKTNGYEVDVTNATNNAEYFKNTYRSYYWYKK